VAIRYDVDPALLAAIVYVTEREQLEPFRDQLEPFRDQLERFATTAFLTDAASTFSLSKRFDVSIGVAQIKPITALTALKVCQATGQPWELWFKHLRDVPEQIGFAKSHPHAAPRSNAFGTRVAEVSRQSWLRERFEGPRLARAQGAPLAR
jgi:hypothetical protein